VSLLVPRRFWVMVAGAVSLLVLVVGVFYSGSAEAAVGPAWKIVATTAPANLPPNCAPTEEHPYCGVIKVTAINVGGSATDGSTVTVSDSLPHGLVAESISGRDVYTGGVLLLGELVRVHMVCAPLPALSCTNDTTRDPFLEVGDQLVLTIKVRTEPGAMATVVNHASVTGGGAESGAVINDPVPISATPVEFGLAPDSTFTVLSTRQAGGHPNVVSGFTLNSGAVNRFGRPLTAMDPKDVRGDLPPGLVGSAVNIPRCTASRVSGSGVGNECPRDTMVGVASVTVAGGKLAGDTAVVPIFNIAPAPGEPVAFMFKVSAFPVRLDTALLSDGGYEVQVSGSNLTQAEPIGTTYLTFWGVPADHEGPGHIALEDYGSDPSVGGLSDSSRLPLLSNPTECSSGLTTTTEADSWALPGVFTAQSTSDGTLEGCGQLPFAASVSMLPDTLQAGAPAGYLFDLNVPQNDEADGLTTAQVKRVVTTLPMGTVISPSSAWGLASCSDEQFFGQQSERGLARPAKPGECPREAQIGTVEITTPALEQPFSGQVYLASPECDPCTSDDAQDGHMVRLFMQAVSEGESGIVVKLEGVGSINQQTGQISVTFDNNPQLPFSDLKLKLAGGERATLANPRACGQTATNVELTAWSTPFTADFTASSPLEITGCIFAQFNPSFVAGTTDIQAGEYTPLTVAFARRDADEFLNGIQIQMPPGLSGSLSNIPLCGEPQAAEGSCGQQSLIGHTQVLTGPGANPYLVTGGQVFLTAGYKGAPFGLSIVVPAVAGPYTLAGTTGRGTVVVRAAINVDPHTAALTITSDPLPTGLDGIPLQLKAVNVTIDRPQFTFNPTSCGKLNITATITSKESAGVNLSSPFQVTNCQALGFKPSFAVSTSGRTSRANGASLDAKVTYPSNTKFANIAKVKVDLPKQLPSRLTTLQKACTAAVFDSNPAACPSASVVGIARANTPILPVPLTGPAYFVSHGGAAFPDLEVLLQGYGVRVDLTGTTFISSKGITSSTFKSVPDVPIRTFELYLPEGKNSALAANGNLCTSKLAMPTAFVAQNGAEIHLSTRISVTGCAKPKKVAKPRGAVKKTASGHARVNGGK
jgi:hypothetical protein